ncbi:MFS transporter [Pseudomonas matsuisoli]|uniref:MFS transporter n=1 Tax=Pseudomonas matsuisoli TaxID=1515666 RepID=A0A917UUR6_9PSED|nr:MFS transporter [Pseudomonas matsuisoli]GGJ86538.1 MFS transporter [Pseudomonas matsuisoli]
MSHSTPQTHISTQPGTLANQAAHLSGGKRATRLAFFIAGFGLSCWAPLVPFAQQRMNADSAMLGTILLCLGLGAVIGMPLAGMLSGRIGTKPVITAGAIGLAIALPLLAILSTPIALGLCLLLFGASLGAIDVAANIHGIEVQDVAKAPLMSGFHGMYSIGGLVGAGGMALIIASGLNVAASALVATAVIIACIATAFSGFFTTRSANNHAMFVIPKGKVLLIGLLTLLIFLGEGAMLDWSALLLTKEKQVDVALSGSAYAVFAFAMTISRLIGDRVVARIGDRLMLLGGFLLTGSGIALVAYFDSLPIILASIALAGLAAGNVVPVLFTIAGQQRSMPASQAIAATSILGYMGVLLGPALVGYVAHFIGLILAFFTLAVLMVLAMSVVSAVPFQRSSEQQ